MAHLAFAMEWWYIGHRARLCTTIVNATSSEKSAIKKWCQTHGLKFKNSKSWQDYLESVWCEKFGIKNSDDIWYSHSEFQAYGSDSKLIELDKFLKTFPTRPYELIVSGMSEKELKAICKGSNHNIIKDLEKEGRFCVSLSDVNTFIYLTLKADIRYNIS